MEDLLMEYMNFEQMTPELLEVWEEISELRNNTENG